MEPPLAFVGATKLAYFAGLSAAGTEYHRTIPQKTNGAKPLFQGSVQEFVAKHPQLEVEFRNEAKRCPSCDKSCATILPFCNGCNHNLADAPSEYTENVCMAFLYGVERGSRFPLGLSLRLETPDVIVYDDLLARSSCHLNAIPSDCHLPDWRHLLRNPAKGLALIERLDEACWKVAHEQFWQDEVWRTRTFRDGAFSSAEDFRSQIYAGVNSVPSQFQVHLQYIVPTIHPVDYHHFLLGKRLVKDRWLSLEYVVGSLQVLIRCGGSLPEAHTMTMEAIFEAIRKFGGPCYEEAHSQAIRRYNRTHRACANWRPEHYEAVVHVRHPALRPELFGAAADSAGETTSALEVRPLPGIGVTSGLSAADVEKRDKVAIQSYGRPYTSDGKPQALSYYSFAKAPGEVLSADAWAVVGTAS